METIKQVDRKTRFYINEHVYIEYDFNAERVVRIISEYGGYKHSEIAISEDDLKSALAWMNHNMIREQ